MMRKTRVPRAPRRLGTGYTVITRRVPSLYISNSTFFGTPVTTNPATSTVLVTLGTAVAHPVFGNNFTIPFSLQFCLDHLSQFADLTDIADRYKIMNVDIKFQYNTDSVTGVPTSGQLQPNMVPSVVWIQDYDDSNVLTAAQLNAKMGVRRKALNNGSFHSIRVRPRIAANVFQGALTAYSVPGKPQWINSSFPTVPHYGIKGYIENMYLGGLTGGASCITADITYKVAIKDFQ